MDDEFRSDALHGRAVQAASWAFLEARRTFGQCLESKLLSFPFSVNKVLWIPDDDPYYFYSYQQITRS